MNTHRRLFQYNGLLFMSCASAISQQVMGTMLSGVPFAMAYIDDISRHSYVYWIFMEKAVEEEHVLRCLRCAEGAKDPPKVESQSWPETNKPWVRVHIDYVGPING
ncbi:unnamed protein product [Schistosoma rodhaini]|nr:unnamed protein product [Schistosoma rodhaini]